MAKDMAVEFDVFGCLWLHLLGMGFWITQQLLWPELVLMSSIVYVQAYHQSRSLLQPIAESEAALLLTSWSGHSA